MKAYWIRFALGGALVAASAFGTASAQTSPDSLNALGPEGRALSSQTGVWDVTETVWPARAQSR